MGLQSQQDLAAKHAYITCWGTQGCSPFFIFLFLSSVYNSRHRDAITGCFLLDNLIFSFIEAIKIEFR